MTTTTRGWSSGTADPAPGSASIGRSTRRQPTRSATARTLSTMARSSRRSGGSSRLTRSACPRHPFDTDAVGVCATMFADARLGDSMFERLFGGRVMDPETAERIPPGQYKTDKFPVLHYGSVPRTDLATWDFKVYGEVDNPFTLTWQDFKKLPRKSVHTDIHCVTRWTKLDTDWEGVPIQEILRLAQVRPSATHVVAHSEQGYTANLPLTILDDDVLLADTYDGKPLE